MKLIDADELEKRMLGYYELARSGDWELREEIGDFFDNTPTIDAVPVVRCKNCKHRDAGNGFCEGRGWPMQLVPDEGFCDKGERSEE